MEAQIYTIFPTGWYRRTKTAKKHAYADDRPPYRGARRTAFCGAHGDAVDIPFRDTEPNAITCARCVAAANAIQERS